MESETKNSGSVVVHELPVGVDARIVTLELMHQCLKIVLDLYYYCNELYIERVAAVGLIKYVKITYEINSNQRTDRAVPNFKFILNLPGENKGITTELNIAWRKDEGFLLLNRWKTCHFKNGGYENLLFSFKTLIKHYLGDIITIGRRDADARASLRNVI